LIEVKGRDEMRVSNKGATSHLPPATGYAAHFIKIKNLADLVGFTAFQTCKVFILCVSLLTS
jgi:hypothetical protein